MRYWVSRCAVPRYKAATGAQLPSYSCKNRTFTSLTAFNAKDYKRSMQTTLKSARVSGMTARRLPLAEALGSGNVPSVSILTVDQCVAALHLAYANGGDWGAALRAALPPRKLRTVDAPAAKSESVAAASGICD